MAACGGLPLRGGLWGAPPRELAEPRLLWAKPDPLLEAGPAGGMPGHHDHWSRAASLQPDSLPWLAAPSLPSRPGRRRSPGPINSSLAGHHGNLPEGWSAHLGGHSSRAALEGPAFQQSGSGARGAGEEGVPGNHELPPWVAVLFGFACGEHGRTREVMPGGARGSLPAAHRQRHRPARTLTHFILPVHPLCARCTPTMCEVLGNMGPAAQACSQAALL